MAWQQLSFTLGALDADSVESALLAAGAVAVTYSDAADQPILEPAPGEAPLWRDARVTALFPEAASIERIGLQLAAALDGRSLPRLDVALIADRAWEREWLKDYQPMRFGDALWVAPHGAEVDSGGATVVRLDPGLAFGTGTHATTALCLAALAARPPLGLHVLDFGCGSGILAIAALKLGAVHALATDIDPQALTATRENAAANAVGERLDTAMAPMQPPRGAFELVIANILAQPLIALAETIAGALAPGGRLLLSGILEEQASEVIKTYDPFVEFDDPAVQDGWVMLEGNAPRV